MKRLLSWFAVVLGCASAAWATGPGTLTSLRAIHLLTNSQASHELPVQFEATITYFRDYERTMFVQDGDVAIYVQATTHASLIAGDRILIKGTTRDSFHPYVQSGDFTLLRHGGLPQPAQASYRELIRAQHDCKLVTVRAFVQTADILLSSNRRNTGLQMLAEGGPVDAVIDSDNPAALKDLLDAEVEITGVASGKFDGKMQQTGILLHVTSLDNVKILKRAVANPWSLPVTPMDEILHGFYARNLTPRIRVQGTITYYQPGSAVVLQNGAKSLWIAAQAHNPMAIGDLADATGFPDVHDGFLTLTGGEIQDLQVLAPVQPVAANWRQLASSVHIFDLVSIEGKVVMEAREASQDEYVLVSGGNLFSAIYRHPPSIAPVPIPLPPMKEVPLGSRVRVTGICALESAVPFDRDVPFSILLRTSNDVAVVARPSLLTIRNLILIVGVLLCVVIAAGAWGWTLKSKVHGQTVALATRIEAEAASERRNAQLEQWRSRILEDINGSRPLAEVIEEITALVSFRLDAAPCWCEIADGARLGGYPTDADILRRVSEPIPARAGPPLGALLAGFDPDSQPGSNESEALIVGARLATLAIETRKLYSDLLHRSEFDLLTDIHNRFSLDSHLEARIAQAREKASIFGLIYVDLDDFKQVNDRYGHRIGDLFLQEAAVRMKRQLRSVDTLARVGGDEFAVLVPEVRNRAKVEEIALRLERCFEEPFAMEGVVLRGSASVGIALYPEDGTSRDSMLSAADAAMYLAKHRHQQIA